MAVPKVTYMSLDQLVLTAEFRKLSPRHAEWVRLYVQGFLQTGIFNHAAATSAVYPSPNPGYIRSTAGRLRHDKKIKAVVQVFLSSADGNLQADLAEIQRHLDASEPGSIAAQRLLSLKKGLKRGGYVDDPDLAENSKSQTGDPIRFVVGETVVQDGKNYRVVSMDAAGQILDAVEID
jgi:hypothetical protein